MVTIPRVLLSANLKPLLMTAAHPPNALLKALMTLLAYLLGWLPVIVPAAEPTVATTVSATAESDAAQSAQDDNRNSTKNPQQTRHPLGSAGESTTAPANGSAPTATDARAASSNVPILDGPTLQSFLHWLQTQNVPPYNVASVTLEGTVGKTSATLAATIVVQINRADEWVRVPVGLNQAFLLAPPVVQGSGETRPDQSSRPKNDGMAWWFRGKGQYQLQLSLSVPFAASNGHRLQLNLPAPPAAASSVKLQVPLDRISVTPQDGAWTQTRSTGDSRTEIVRYGLGTMLDLAWEPIPEVREVEPELRASTLIAVDLTVDSIMLKATQTIRALQGNVDEVKVQIPAGFDLVDVTGDEVVGDDYVPDSRDISKPHTVTLYLDEPTKGPIDVTWRLHRDLPGDQERVALAGFRVLNADRQDGYVVVGSLEGYRVSRHDDGNRFVQRVSVSQLRAYPELLTQIGAGQISSAYEFLKQPFHLTLLFQRIEPNYRIEPYYFLRMSPDRIDLEVLARFHIYEGAIEEFDLPWPAYESDGWMLGIPESPELVQQVLTSIGSGKPGLRVILAERKTKRDGPFDVRFRLWRPLSTDGSAFDVSLPRAATPSGSPARLVVGSAENVETTLSPKENTLWRPFSASAESLASLPPDFQGLRRMEFSVVDSPACDFQATIVVHERRLTTDATVRASVQNRRIYVKQWITYDIAYAHLSQIRLLVPKTIERVRFALTDSVDSANAARNIVPTWTDLNLDVEDFRQARLTLDEPRINQLVLLTEFDLPLLDTPDAELPVNRLLPLIRSDDIEQYRSVRFELENSDVIHITLDNERWQQEPNRGQLRRWYATGAQAAIPLTIAPTTTGSRQDVSITQSYLRTQFEESGQTRWLAGYRFAGAPTELEIQFPVESRVVAIFLNQQPLPPDRIREDASTPGRYHLSLSELTADGENRLAIHFTNSYGKSFGLSESHSLTPPSFIAGATMGETFWELVLPYKYLLFAAPSQFTPQFRWQRSFVLYRRKANPAPQNIATWFGPAGLPADAPVFAGGNDYAFSCLGTPPPLQFRSISQSALLALGAGVALAIGVILIQITVLRHALTVLALAFAMSVCGLWYAEQIQLLLQPALLGLLLAVGAAMIQGAGRRRRSQHVVTVTAAPSDFAAGSSVERVLPVPIGADVPPAYRPTVDVPTPPTPSADEGSET